MEKFDIEEASFNYLVKHGVNSKANKESLIALYLPDNCFQKMHCYEFPIIKELKWRNGAKTKYEIPQYISDIPEDYPVFCTIKEAGMIKNKLKKKEDRKKNKSNIKSKDKVKDKEKNNDKENISTNSNNNNNNNNILDEPIPNEMHKYCHLCKKNFDNYIRHINSKIHKDNTNRYAPKFNNIKNIFKRINTFWDNKKENNESKSKKEDNINNNTQIDNNKNSIIKDEINLDEESYKLKIFTQFNQNVKEGCKAKKKILVGNSSQLSTAQSFPIIPPKKRKKNEVKNKSKSKKKQNKNINEFLIKGEFVNITKIKRENINFYNNYYD